MVYFVWHKSGTLRIVLFIGFLLLNSLIPVAQVKNIVFEGAGIKGLAYSGVISELASRGILDKVTRVGGTSAGATTAMLVSVGYSPEEIREIISNTPFKKFNQGRFLFFGGLNRLRTFYGWYHGEKMEKWLKKLLENKTGNPDISFMELKEKGYKDLYVTGTSLNNQRLVVFSHENYPRMKVRDAVRISMSIPLYFEPVFMDSLGNIIKHPKETDTLNIMVDGGLVANFPLRIFDSTKYFMPSIPNESAINPQTLGFRIDNEEQIISDRADRKLVPVSINGFNQYLVAFYRVVMENLNRLPLGDKDWERTVSISDGGINSRIRTLSQEQVDKLFNNGAQAVRSYFDPPSPCPGVPSENGKQ